MSNSNHNSAKANYLKSKILSRIESLIIRKYNKKLTPDEHFILSCLLGEIDYEQIARAHGRLKANRVETIPLEIVSTII